MHPELQLRLEFSNDITVAKSSSFAVEALAGLASTEDFSAVTLRNVTETSVSTNKLQPYKDLMLILIKGRRHVQARLIEPVAECINSGDNYILVTKSEVIIDSSGRYNREYVSWFSFSERSSEATSEECIDHSVERTEWSAHTCDGLFVREKSCLCKMRTLVFFAHFLPACRFCSLSIATEINF